MIPKQVQDFLNTLAGRSLKTKSNYTSFATVFWDYLSNAGSVKPLKDITIQDILKFLTWGTENKKWKLSTMRQYAKLTVRFMSEFKDEAFMKDLRKQFRMLPKVQAASSLLEGIYIPPDKLDSRGNIVESKINEFIATAPGPDYEAVYTMILKWGLRLNEALTQDLEDIKTDTLRVIVRGKGQGFEGKVRMVLIGQDSLDRVLKDVGSKKKGRIVSLSPRSVEYEWKRSAKKIGLSFWKRLTPHDGRHSYAIDFLKKRKKEGMMALTLLKTQLGHSDIKTTFVYLDIAGVETQEIFESGNHSYR